MFKKTFHLSLTLLVEQQSQVLPVARADVKEQSRTLGAPETQRNVFSSQVQVGQKGGQMGAAAPV